MTTARRLLVLQILDIYRAIALGTAEFETEDPYDIIFVSSSRHHTPSLPCPACTPFRKEGGADCLCVLAVVVVVVVVLVCCSAPCPRRCRT